MSSLHERQRGAVKSASRAEADSVDALGLLLLLDLLLLRRLLGSRRTASRRTASRGRSRRCQISKALDEVDHSRPPPPLPTFDSKALTSLPSSLPVSARKRRF